VQKKELKETNLASMKKDNFAGQKSILHPKTTMLHKITVIPIMKLVPFSLKSIMTALMNASSVIPQLILSLCTISIMTCNNFFNQMTPFNGDKVRPRVTAWAGGKTFLGSLTRAYPSHVWQLNLLMLLSLTLLSNAEYKIHSTALLNQVTKWNY